MAFDFSMYSVCYEYTHNNIARWPSSFQIGVCQKVTYLKSTTFACLEQIAREYKDYVGLLNESMDFIAHIIQALNCACAG